MKSIISQPYTIKAYWVLPYCQQLPLATDIVNHAWIAVHQCNTHTLTWVSITCRWIITSSFIWPSSVPYLPNNSRPFLTFVLFAKLPQEMLHPLSWVPGACNQWKRSVRLISVFFLPHDRGDVIHPTRARTPHSVLIVWTLTGCLDSDWLLIGRPYGDWIWLDEWMVGLGCDLMFLTGPC